MSANINSKYIYFAKKSFWNRLHIFVFKYALMGVEINLKDIKKFFKEFDYDD